MTTKTTLFSIFWVSDWILLIIFYQTCSCWSNGPPCLIIAALQSRATALTSRHPLQQNIVATDWLQSVQCSMPRSDLPPCRHHCLTAIERGSCFLHHRSTGLLLVAMMVSCTRRYTQRIGRSAATDRGWRTKARRIGPVGRSVWRSSVDLTFDLASIVRSIWTQRN